MTVERGFFMPCFNAVIIFFLLETTKEIFLPFDFKMDRRLKRKVWRSASLGFFCVLQQMFAAPIPSTKLKILPTFNTWSILLGERASGLNLRFFWSRWGGEAVLFVCDGIYNSVAGYNLTWRVLFVCLRVCLSRSKLFCYWLTFKCFELGGYFFCL